MNRSALLALLLSEMVFVSPQRPERDFLLAHDWVPLGKEAFTDLEGWGKVIEGKACTVNEAEALSMEGYAA